VKTSGSKGFHLFVPLDGTLDWGTVARVAHSVGRELVRRDPARLTQEFHKADRGGRIFRHAGTAAEASGAVEPGTSTVPLPKPWA
jgi:DNA primase